MLARIRESHWSENILVGRDPHDKGFKEWRTSLYIPSNGAEDAQYLPAPILVTAVPDGLQNGRGHRSLAFYIWETLEDPTMI